MTAAQPIYLYGDTGGDWHDYTCPCDRHCRNCHAALTGRARLYCSEWCGRQYRAALAFDRMMQAAPTV